MGQLETEMMKELVQYRIQTAKSDLQSANILIEAGESGEQTTVLTMQFIMQYLQFTLWMESHTNVIKILWQILIKIM